jgi:hypothetical protein
MRKKLLVLLGPTQTHSSDSQNNSWDENWEIGEFAILFFYPVNYSVNHKIIAQLFVLISLFKDNDV